MKRLGVSFKNSFFIFLLLGAAACVTFRPAARASGPEVETFITCRAVAAAGGLHVPESAGDTFGADIESVYALVKLSDVGLDTWLRWRWYSPDGRLARDSGRIAVATQGRLLEAVTAFDRLDLAADPAARPAGVWTVVLFVEETLAEQTVFTIMLKK